jgi:hypothetical protein
VHETVSHASYINVDFHLCISRSVVQCHDMSVCNVNKHGFNGAFGDYTCFTLTIWSILCMEFIQYSFCIHFQILMCVQFSFCRAINCWTCDWNGYYIKNRHKKVSWSRFKKSWRLCIIFLAYINLLKNFTCTFFRQVNRWNCWVCM